MITHFQYKPLFENTELPGWHFSFYYNKSFITGKYLGDGTIDFSTDITLNENEALKKQIHEMMLFHVYDR